MRVPSLGWKDPLEEEMATHSSILVWRIPWKRSLVGYSPRGHKELDTTENTCTPIAPSYRESEESVGLEHELYKK